MSTGAGRLRIYLVRHGETEWSASGKHTSTTDVPLTAHGMAQARLLASQLRGIKFERVFTSPRRRARHTCELMELETAPEVSDQIREWDYGEYEGMKTAEIRQKARNWNLFNEGAPGGENPAEVQARAQRFVQMLRGLSGNVAVFSHGHFLRVLGAVWINLPASAGMRFGLTTASLSILAFEHGSVDEPIIALWNSVSSQI